MAPYAGAALGLDLDTLPSVEVVDHVIPGIVILAVAAVGVFLQRLSLPATLLVALAGLWMTATHIPLLNQVRTGLVELGPALWHSVPGFAVFIFAIALSAAAWKEAGEGT